MKNQPWLMQKMAKHPLFNAEDNVIMTKQDFVEIADTIKRMEHVPEEYRRQMALAFIHFFQSKNPRFDEVRFITACGFTNQ